MAVTLGSLTISNLRAQPLGYAETDVLRGLVARSWAVEGLITPAEWLSLLGIFETWQSARRLDPDSLTSLTVGTTVTFSGTAAGVSWTNVGCWFTAAPAGESVGAYIGASFELVHAQQQLAVWIKQREQELATEQEALPSYGTLTLGGATITLTENPDGYAEGPQLQRTASGGFYINGPLGAVRAKRITGYTTASGWALIEAWYESTAAATPVRGTYYPASPPSLTLEPIISGGVRTDRYVVSLELWEV